MSEYVGVDISKLTFDADWISQEKRVAKSFTNDEAGYLSLLDQIDSDAHVVMEATGTYYLGLANFLYDNEIAVSVVNPIQTRHYARMRLMRSKTDPVDARICRTYGEDQRPVLWNPPNKTIDELNQLDSYLQGLVKQRTQVLNRLEAINQRPEISQYVLEGLEQQREDLSNRIHDCEDTMLVLVRAHYGEIYELLTSIKGIGPRIAMMLIVLTDGFRRFKDPKEFVTFIGLSTFVRRSGSSLSVSSISKMGQSRLRHLLYVASMVAMQWNPSCQRFAERLRSNGKPHKVVRIAVANKMIRQAFAVVNKREAFSPEYA